MKIAGYRFVEHLFLSLLMICVVSGTWAQTGTPPKGLIESVKSGDLKSAGELLRAGANPNAMDGEGQTALHYAAYQGNTDAAKLLLAARADVNVRDASGLTPLHAAAFEGRVLLASLLLQKGAAVGPRDAAGNTPLHYAVLGDHVEMAALLLGTGAEPLAVNARGQSPAQIAQAMNNPRIVALFSEEISAPGAPKKPVRTYTDEDLAKLRETSTLLFQEGGPPSAATRPTDSSLTIFDSTFASGSSGSSGPSDRQLRERRDLESRLPALQKKCEEFKAKEGSGQPTPALQNSLGCEAYQEYKRQWEADRRAGCGEYDAAMRQLGR